MNMYKEMMKKHEERVNKFKYKFFAFNEEQFKEGMNKIGLNENDTDKIVSIGLGGYVLKSKIEDFENIFKNNDKELRKALKEDATGTGFIKEMFLYNMWNIEYIYCMDDERLLKYCNLTLEEYNNNIAFQNGYKLAKKQYFNEVDA